MWEIWGEKKEKERSRNVEDKNGCEGWNRSCWMEGKRRDECVIEIGSVNFESKYIICVKSVIGYM